MICSLVSDLESGECKSVSAVLSLPRLCLMSWGGKQEGALLFCCSVTNHWSRAVFPYSFPLVSLPALVSGLPGAGSSRGRGSSWRASPAQGGAVALQNWTSLCVILVIIFVWLLLKLSMTFCTHPMKRSLHGWVIPGETGRMKLLGRMTFQGLPRLVC